MGKTVYRHRWDVIFILIIFCVFAMSVLIVLTLSGSIYKNLSQSIEDGYNEQTCLSYIWSKVKNGDGGGRVYTGEFNGISSLFIEEEYDGFVYITRIYLYDNWVRELIGDAEIEFDPEAGQQIIKASSLFFEETEAGLIKAVSDSGELYIAPRTQSGLSIPDGE